MESGQIEKISIITVSYNSAKTIEKTIQSVLNQTYKNLEYIIVDGGSTDGTVDIIKKYEDKISYWVSESDKGIYDAMNKGIDKASGDIIGIINSDDWYTEKTVQCAVDSFKNTQADVVHGDVLLVDKSRSPVLLIRPSKNIKNIWHTMIYNHPTAFVRRSVYKELGKFNINYDIAADYDLFLRLYINNKFVYYNNNILVYMSLGGISDCQQINGAKEVRNISTKYGYGVYKANTWLIYKVLRITISKVLKNMNLKKILYYRRKLFTKQAPLDKKSVPIVYLS